MPRNPSKRFRVEISSDYRILLRRILLDRTKANPRYSLRAFARDLGLQPPRLSLILNNKQGLSEEVAIKLAERLKLSGPAAERFLLMVKATDSRSKAERTKAARLLAELEDSTDSVQKLEQDAFKLIADWHHYAILELITLPQYKGNDSWIARKLALQPSELKSALDRLERLGLAVYEGDRWASTELNLTVGNPADTSEALRKFNRQILHKAASAMDTQDSADRDYSTLTVSINTREINELRDLIRTFRRRFNAATQGDGKNPKAGHDEVYCLAVQFFRLTEKDI